MKFLKELGLAAAVLSLAACSSTVGNNEVDEYGKLVNDELDWPALKDASLPEGIFPNKENLSKIAAGVTKKDLYYLIERPHFSETNGAREWNYIMKFREDDGSAKICQYKVLFDDEQLAQSFYWKPKDCRMKTKISLNADALFNFNRGGLNDIKAAGKAELDEFAGYLKENEPDAKLEITGYTDYLGSDTYNMALSEERADSVKQYLVNKGVSGDNINAVGMGEANPVVNCEDSGDRPALINCLAPNRRVEIEIQ